MSFEEGVMVQLNRVAHQRGFENPLTVWETLLMCEPVGPQEVAEILGVSTKRVYQLRGKPAFPKVKWHLATGPLWEKEEIDEYAKIPESAAGQPADHDASPSAPDYR